MSSASEAPKGGALFAPKTGNTQPQPTSRQRPYKILIVDDDESIHELTRLVLRNYTFEGRGLHIDSVFSGIGARRYLVENPDVVLVLLDVVMESDKAGLDLVKYIRDELKNRNVRLILRTGQPGQAPEQEVIANYDINDYKEKTELTAQKLFTTITAALRGYRDLVAIEESRKGLRSIIDATADLFEPKSLGNFAEGVLRQLNALLHIEEPSIYMHASSLAAAQEGKERFYILSATGKYREHAGMPLEQAIAGDLLEKFQEVLKSRRCLIDKDRYFGYFETKTGSRNLIYIEGVDFISEINRNMLAIYSNNVAIAFDNLYLNQELLDTQKQIVCILGEAVERRSHETGKHVWRMTGLSCLLGQKMGLPQAALDVLRLCAPLHDVGKIGIPDHILSKPGSLTTEEFEIIKTHTTIGGRILTAGAIKSLSPAATIALQHHERWDGTGYPQKLAGNNINILARIVCLADVVDALGHTRCYKEAWDIDHVVQLVKEQREKHFDPALTDIFLSCIEEYLKIERSFNDAD